MISIRRATELDADAIARLAGSLGHLTDSDSVRTGIQTLSLSDSDSLFVAIDSSGFPLGWIHAHAAYVLDFGKRVEILGLVVSSEVRRMGIGRALVETAECWGANIGAKAVVVRSNVQRVESHDFYLALGYDGVKTQTVYRKPLVHEVPLEGQRSLGCISNQFANHGKTQ